jgi:N-ethylmaleimide reductase
MSPMTRATPDHIPTALMVTYYGQRADAGLIISEGVSPSAEHAIRRTCARPVRHRPE